MFGNIGKILERLTSPLTTVSFAFCTAGCLIPAFMACCAALRLLEGKFGDVRMCEAQIRL